MIDVYSRDWTIGFSHIDRSGALSPRAVLAFFDETAVAHAESLGLGYGPMLTRGAAWVLSRITVLVESRPRRGDTVTVETWPCGRDRLFALRDYEILADGRTVVRARASWLILDLEKRRPLRPALVMDALPQNEGRNTLDENPPGLLEAPGLGLVSERMARYSDLDFNGHVNWTRYLEWICDLFEPQQIETASSLRFDINYLKEITASSVTGLWMSRHPESDGAGVRHIEGRQGAELMFRARMIFRGEYDDER